jgi:hypothetical protein
MHLRDEKEAVAGRVQRHLGKRRQWSIKKSPSISSIIETKVFVWGSGSRYDTANATTIGDHEQRIG